MLTGDKKKVGENIAKKLSIDTVYAELLPDGKVEKIESLLKEKSEKGKLLFAGDGINDAPVLISRCCNNDRWAIKNSRCNSII